MTTETRETRVTKWTPEIRVHTEPKDDSIGTITGYAAIFDSLSEDLGGFRETIAPGTFKRALAEKQDVLGLIDHSASQIIGRTGSGTMTLQEDDKGLGYTIEVADTSAGRDILTSLRRKDVSASSFAFEVIEDRWYTKDGEEIRELMDVNLFDVSVVSQPAYKATVAKAAFRSLHARTRPNRERFRVRLGAVKKYLVADHP